MVTAELPRTAKFVGRLLQSRDKSTPDLAARLAGAGYTPERVLGDWYPEDR